MLSQNAINKLVQEIVDRQESIDTKVIELMAKRIKEIGELKPSDVYKLERILKSGGDVQKINAMLSSLSGVQVNEIKRLIKQIALDSYLDTKPYYDYRNKPFIPFEKNIELQQIVEAIGNQTANSYVNLSRSRAFMIRDPQNPSVLIPTTLSKTYYSVVDEAITASQQGIIDYSTAIRNTLKQLVDSGIRTVSYHPESGRIYTQSIEAAVQRNVLDGIRQLNLAVQEEVGRQYGADGKEITVHENSAPDHEPVQGHQFTNEEYAKLQSDQPCEDVNGNRFPAMERAIGQYNCYHFTYSIIIGVNKPNFTEAELQAYKDRNKQGYTDSKGKHYTMYECTQKQRELERHIRKAKTLIVAARAAGDETLLSQGKADLKKYQDSYTTFSKACGLSKNSLKTRVQGYRR